VPDITAYAEMAVASKTAHAAVAIRIVLEGLGYGVAGATPLLGDNKAVRDIIVKNGASAKTRHFERVAMTVQRFYQQRSSLSRTSSAQSIKLMVADIYNKALDRQTFFSRSGTTRSTSTAAPARASSLLDRRRGCGRRSLIK